MTLWVLMGDLHKHEKNGKLNGYMPTHNAHWFSLYLLKAMVQMSCTLEKKPLARNNTSSQPGRWPWHCGDIVYLYCVGRHPVPYTSQEEQMMCRDKCLTSGKQRVLVKWCTSALGWCRQTVRDQWRMCAFVVSWVERPTDLKVSCCQNSKSNWRDKRKRCQIFRNLKWNDLFTLTQRCCNLLRITFSAVRPHLKFTSVEYEFHGANVSL